MSILEQKWTDTKKEKGSLHVACPSMTPKKNKKNKKKGCMSVHEQKWMDTQEKRNFEDEVTLSHVSKSTT